MPAPAPRSIVIVDDDPEAVELLAAAIHRLRWPNAIVTFTDGDALLAFFRKNYLAAGTQTAALPCAILMDLKMPAVTGFDILEWLSRHEMFRDVMRVVVSTSEAPEDMKRARELGAHQYLFKFPHPQTLQVLLAQVAAQKPTSEQTAS